MGARIKSGGKTVTRRTRQGRTLHGKNGAVGQMQEMTTIAEPIIPIIPWLAGPGLYLIGLFLHYVWLHSLAERLIFVPIFALAGWAIGRFAAEYGRARTPFQRRHAAWTPPLFSLILSWAMVIGWGRITVLLIATYWVVLAGGWVARVARSVWGDGTDTAPLDPQAVFGEALGVPGLMISPPKALTAGPSARQGGLAGRLSLTATREKLASKILGQPVQATSLPAAPPRAFTQATSGAPGAGAPSPAGDDLPFDAVDVDGDGFDDLTGKVINRRLTARGLQGFNDIAAQTEGLRNVARAHLVTVHPVVGNPQAADVRFVMEDLLRTPTAVPGPSQPPGSSAALPLRIGIRQDGRPELISLNHTMRNAKNELIYVGALRCSVAGCSGAGKSGLTWNVLYELADRGEVTVWMSDAAKAGQTAAPALGMIDWLAIDIEDTEAMLDSLLEIIRQRSRDLGRKGYTSGWAPGCGLNLLVVLFEEAANIATASRSISTKLTRLAEQARSVGIVLFISMQRPSAQNMPTGARAQRSARFCFGLDDPTTDKMALSAATLEGGATPSKLNITIPGMHWYEGQEVPTNEWAIPARTFLVEFGDLLERVRQGAPYRTPLDDLTVAAAGEGYTRRFGAHNPPEWLLVPDGDAPAPAPVQDAAPSSTYTPPARPTYSAPPPPASSSVAIPRPRESFYRPPISRDEEIVDAEIIDPDEEYAAYVAETTAAPVDPRTANAHLSPLETLDKILRDNEVTDGIITTKWLLECWTATTTRHRRDMYRAIKDSGRLSSAGAPREGRWLVQSTSERSRTDAE